VIAERSQGPADHISNLSDGWLYEPGGTARKGRTASGSTTLPPAGAALEPVGKRSPYGSRGGVTRWPCA
jgi:hypothetical protein